MLKIEESQSILRQEFIKESQSKIKLRKLIDI